VIPNKKGQALVEFVLILPILLILIFLIIDLGRIIYTKNNLVNMVSDASDMYQKNIDKEKILEVLNSQEKITNLDIYEKDSLTYIKLTKNINLLTPGLNIILKNPYEIITTRVVPNE